MACPDLNFAQELYRKQHCIRKKGNWIKDQKENDGYNYVIDIYKGINIFKCDLCILCLSAGDVTHHTAERLLDDPSVSVNQEI